MHMCAVDVCKRRLAEPSLRPLSRSKPGRVHPGEQPTPVAGSGSKVLTCAVGDRSMRPVVPPVPAAGSRDLCASVRWCCGLQAMEKVVGPPEAGDPSDGLSGSPDKPGCRQHYVLDVRSEAEVRHVRGLCDRWHLAHYNAQWDMERRAATRGIGHLRFLFEVGFACMSLTCVRGGRNVAFHQPRCWENRRVQAWSTRRF